MYPGYNNLYVQFGGVRLMHARVMAIGHFVQSNCCPTTVVEDNLILTLIFLKNGIVHNFSVITCICMKFSGCSYLKKTKSCIKFGEILWACAELTQGV